MKLLFCTSCFDVIALAFEERKCLCEQSSGQYKDKVNAVVKGPCQVLGINNSKFMRSLALQLSEGDQENQMGREFTAWIMPEAATSVERA